MATEKQKDVQPTSILGGKAVIAFVGDVSILITNAPVWTSADISGVLEETIHLGGLRNNVRAFTHHFGEIFGADATQRKQLVEWQTANNVPPVYRVITISDSAVMRAAMTAYYWMTKTNAKAFKSTEMDAACRWLTEGCDTSPEKVHAAVLASYKVIGKQ